MTEVEELRRGAAIIRERITPVTAWPWGDAEVAAAVADLLEYAAERLEAHPNATGPMTQGCLTIAREITRYAAMTSGNA